MSYSTHRLILPAVIAVVFACGSHAFAEEIRIPLGQQNLTPEWRAQQPERGMTKSQVEANYGAPDSRQGPNGTPPIYYWEYADFTVYFEGDYVIHAVSKHLKATQ